MSGRSPTTYFTGVAGIESAASAAAARSSPPVAATGSFGRDSLPQAARTTSTAAKAATRLRMLLRRIGSVPRFPLREERLDELVGIELDEVVGRLSQAHELDGEAQLGADGHGDAALGRAVQLGEHHAGDAHGLGELLGLH